MQAYNPLWPFTQAKSTQEKSLTQAGPTKENVIFFPEGEGHAFVQGLYVTSYSKTAIVRSVKDDKLYVRKEVFPVAKQAGEQIQNVVVATVRYLQHKGLAGSAELAGWIEYQELGAKVVCMLKIFLDSIEVGVLHADAHHSNWFIEIEPQSASPRTVLGDWGIYLIKPIYQEDQTILNKWFQKARDHLYHSVLEESRTLITYRLQGKGNLRERVDSLMWKGQPGAEFLAMLVHFINSIDDAKLSAFATGEDWLTRLKSIYDQATGCQHNPTRIATGPADHLACQPRRMIEFLPLNLALEHVSWWNNLDLNGNQPACLWVIAELDQTRGCVAFSSPPSAYMKTRYEDVTDWGLVPNGWREAHERTIAWVRRYIPEFGDENKYINSDYQGELYGGSVI